MASELTIFSIYKTQKEDHYYLLRTEQPSYSNASQIQEDLANKIEQSKREFILDLIAKKHRQNKTDFKFIGELQSYPIGEKLYAENGNLELDIYFMETAFGHPWIIIGNSPSETEFLAALYDDEELLELKPVGKPIQIKAIFLTENDFDLSAIKHSDIKDIRPDK